MKLLIMQSSRASATSSLVGPNILLSSSFSDTVSLFFPYCGEQQHMQKSFSYWNADYVKLLQQYCHGTIWHKSCWKHFSFSQVSV